MACYLSASSTMALQSLARECEASQLQAREDRTGYNSARSWQRLCLVSFGVHPVPRALPRPRRLSRRTSVPPFQVAFLKYRLPALACAPPLLLRLSGQRGPRGSLLSVEIVASPNLPGHLTGVKLALNVPSAQANPSKVPPKAPLRSPLQLPCHLLHGVPFPEALVSRQINLGLIVADLMLVTEFGTCFAVRRQSRGGHGCQKRSS